MNLLSQARNVVRQRLSGQMSPTDLRKDLQGPMKHILQLIIRTVELGEGNSLLVIGPEGSGKSTLIEKVLQSLHKDAALSSNLLEVRLNGLMQTDDRLALEEITRQLNLENTVGDKVFGSFAENLTFLLEALKTGNSSTSRPVLFLLEEFDLIASHKNQTLLYNLFDIAQARSTPIVVIGLSCRLDVMDLLEKRVKSRFSHRQIYICNGDSFEDYVATFANCLTLQIECFDVPYTAKKQVQSFLARWNDYIQRIISDPSVMRSLKSQYNICKEVYQLYAIVSLPLTKLDPASDYSFICSAIVDQIAISHSDNKVNLMHGLTVLELCLIIAMHHITDVYTEPFNFQMVYVEFLKFARRRSHILQNHSKQVLMKAYEHLIELELVKPVDCTASKASIFGGSRSNLQKEYRSMQLLVQNNQLHSAVHRCDGCPTDVRQWALSGLD